MHGYLAQGGLENALNLLLYAASLLGGEERWLEPKPLPAAGIWHTPPDLDALKATWREGQPVAAIVFYRALVQAGDTAPITALVKALADEGLNPLPLFVTSLKDPMAAGVIESVFAETPPSVTLNATAFAVASPGRAEESPLSAPGRVVLQVVLGSGSEETWRNGMRGLGPRDIAMSVALPEVDGRVLAGAISFKAPQERDRLTEADLLRHRPVEDRVHHAAKLAAAWASLARTPAGERRIALVLANYPNRDGRLGNGVGLDTPASTALAIQALADAGYHVEDAPATAKELMDRLLAGPTNNLSEGRSRKGGEMLKLPDYLDFWRGLPQETRAKVEERWGAPEQDPFFEPGHLECGGFRLALHRFGNLVVGVQPARGYNINPQSSYHDPDLPPPHFYLAFHAWLRNQFGAQAIVHMGKHGNLEWLPGKAVALSQSCFPEAALGPLPNLYPFIVNDPGEGTHAPGPRRELWALARAGASGR
jgi:cobaltochelatase CobN